MKTLSTALLLLLLSTTALFADSIGLTVNQIIDDTSWGITGEKQFESINAELDASLQSGDLYLGQYHANIILLGNIKVFADGTIKGYQLDGLGRQADLGLAATFDAGGLTIDLGIFGRNAGVFATPNARGDLLDRGYAEADLPADLANISPAPAGLTFKDGNSINALISTELGPFKIRALPELFGSGVPVHQLITNYEHDWTLPEVDKRLTPELNLSIELGLQKYDGTIEYETASIVTISIDF